MSIRSPNAVFCSLKILEEKNLLRIQLISLSTLVDSDNQFLVSLNINNKMFVGTFDGHQAKSFFYL